MLKVYKNTFIIPNQGRIQDFPFGGPTLVGGGANLRHRCFLVKTYVKRKEFGPVGGGGGHTPQTYVCRSATANRAGMHKMVLFTLEMLHLLRMHMGKWM